MEYCKSSYRSGTRITPQDETAIKVEDDPNKIEKVGGSFDTKIKVKKHKLEIKEAVSPKLPVSKIFPLKKKKKQKKGVG